MRALVLVTIPMVFLAGCQGSGPELDLEVAESPVIEQVDPPTDPPSMGEPEAAEESTGLALVPCEDETRGAIEATVVGQVEAFSVGDFEAAYAFASPSFQAGMPLPVFEQLIAVNYPQLLDARSARSGSCNADLDAGVSTIQIRIETNQDTTSTLRYVLEYIEESWRIIGASEEQTADVIA